VDPIVDEVDGEVFSAEPEPVGVDGCERCGYLARRVEAHERRAEGMAQDIANLQRDSVGDLRKIARLEAELEKQKVDDPDWSTAKSIFLDWVKESGRNPKTTKFGEKRSKAVLARLKEYDPDFVRESVIAGVRTANPQNREAEREALIASLHEAIRLLGDDTEEAKQLREFYREKTKGLVRYDDLELICRNEVNLERFHAAAVRMGTAQGV
jgi:hypothetical protein